MTAARFVPTRMALALGILACGFGLQAPPVAAQQAVENPPDPFVHQTGATFPTSVGDFRRTTIYHYDDQGADMSVGYDLIRSGQKLASVTFYVYPSYFRAAEPDDAARCDRDFQDIRKSIVQAHDGAKEDTSHGPPRTPDGIKGTIRFASYRYKGEFAKKQQKLRSDAWLSCRPHSDWLIAYRASWPSDKKVQKDVEALLNAIAWPRSLPADDASTG